MGIGQVLKEAVVSFVDGFKSRVDDKKADNNGGVSLFNNSDTNETNVLFKLKDGNYGILEPEK